MMTLADAIRRAHRGATSSIPCPGHDDTNPSLSVGPGVEQDVVLKCHAGCEAADILTAEGLEWSAICRPREDATACDGEWTPAGSASHVYTYTDSEGNELFQVLRVPQADGSKTFRQRHRDPDDPDHWIWNVRGLPRLPYRVVEVERGIQGGRVIWVFEGEKDVEVARAHGLVATCNVGGAGKWTPECTAVLAGAEVVVCSDADETGRRHAREVATALAEHDCRVKVVESTIAKDFAEHVVRQGTPETLVEVWNSHPEEKNRTGMGIRVFLHTDWGEDEEIIPGHFAHSNVAVVTGFEGFGKSTFLRQLGACCASGINMFQNFAPMAPLKVLYIDAENPEHQLALEWRRIIRLTDSVSQGPTDDTLILMNEWENEPALDLPEGHAWLMERVAAYKPDLCIMGPIQNLASRDLKDDDVVRRIKRAVNSARSISGTAFILEHHSPHRAAGDKERSVRPYGSSLFLKWPDYGYGLRPDMNAGVPGIFELVENRKPRVRARAWPSHMRQGDLLRGEWPWEPYLSEAGSTVVRGRFGS